MRIARNTAAIGTLSMTFLVAISSSATATEPATKYAGAPELESAVVAPAPTEPLTAVAKKNAIEVLTREPGFLPGTRRPLFERPPERMGRHRRPQ